MLNKRLYPMAGVLLILALCSCSGQEAPNVSDAEVHDDTVRAAEPTTNDNSSASQEAAKYSEPRDTSLAGGPTTTRDRAVVAILNSAMACRRAESLRALLKANPMADQEVRTSLVEANRMCLSVPSGESSDVEALGLELAKQGNGAAAACYVSGLLRPTSGPAAVAALSSNRFAREVPALIEQGIAAGNWLIVVQAVAINTPRSIHSPYFPLPEPDPVKGYMYTRLLELGAKDDEKQDLSLVALERSKAISASERVRADSRAIELYRKHFQSKGGYTHEKSELCALFN